MHYINGQWTMGNGAAFASHNPATGAKVWSGHAADATQVHQAIASAHAACDGWAATPFEIRAKIVTAFSDRVKDRADELASLISQETGKIGWDAKGEVAATIGKARFSLAAHAERTPDKHSDMQGFRATLRHRPHGVMAVYGPYNFPAHLPNGHITPALLAGNCVVFKPSEMTPGVAEWMVKQWEAVGLPKGVLNLVQGEKDTGIALAAGDINGLLFTGSSATGALLHRQFAGRPEVLLALEMGGNNPLVVHDVKDIKAAVHETILSAYISSGQRCTCARRLIVTDGPWQQPFIDQLSAAVAALRVGKAGDEPEPFMGPMVANREAEKLLQAQKMLQQNGAKALVEMRRLHDTLPLVSPGLIDTTNVAQRPDEEWFGPLLQLICVPDFTAAIAEANHTQFGLSAGLLSDSADAYATFVQCVRAGIINWNKQTTGASGMAPFGGVGCSGNHHPAGYYAADYCSVPVASMEAEKLTLPEQLSPGMVL